MNDENCVGCATTRGAVLCKFVYIVIVIKKINFHIQGLPQVRLHQRLKPFQEDGQAPRTLAPVGVKQ